MSSIGYLELGPPHVHLDPTLTPPPPSHSDSPSARARSSHHSSFAGWQQPRLTKLPQTTF